MPELQYICMMRSLLSLCLCLSLAVMAQQGPPADLLLLKKGYGGGVLKNKPVESLNDRKPMQTRRQDPFSKANPVILVLKGSMLVYQYVISPQLSAGCIFERSCSNYAKEAIRTTGIIRGILLTADRLTRCNRSALGYTPPFNINAQGKVRDEPCIQFDE